MLRRSSDLALYIPNHHTGCPAGSPAIGHLSEFDLLYELERGTTSGSGPTAEESQLNSDNTFSKSWSQIVRVQIFAGTKAIVEVSSTRKFPSLTSYRESDPPKANANPRDLFTIALYWFGGTGPHGVL